MFDTEEAREFYDRIGSYQDSQWFYEDKATRELLRHMDLESARSLVEFGTGTGRFASEVLRSRLPHDARYHGFDLSTTMVGLARARLVEFSKRIEVTQTDGRPDLPIPDAEADRLVSNYVMDLLPEETINDFILEAKRILKPGGLLGLTSLTNEVNIVSRLVVSVWKRIFNWKPKLVGGCRPIELLAYLPEEDWSVAHHRKMSVWGVPSEVVVAVRAADS